MTDESETHLEWRACATDTEGGIAGAWTRSLPNAQRELNDRRRADPPFADTFLERRWVTESERVDVPTENRPRKECP